MHTTPQAQDSGSSVHMQPLKIAYADPPYPGQSRKHYSQHPDYAGEVDHGALAFELSSYDGWVLHTSSPALPSVLTSLVSAGLTFRIGAWVKPFAAFKRNVPVAYAWEPVIFSPARKQMVTGRMVMRDFVSQPMTTRRGLAGAKPEAVCHWAFEMIGAMPDDDLTDLFPGTGAVTRAWETWRNRLQLPLALHM